MVVAVVVAVDGGGVVVVVLVVTVDGDDGGGVYLDSVEHGREQRHNVLRWQHLLLLKRNHEHLCDAYKDRGLVHACQDY